MGSNPTLSAVPGRFAVIRLPIPCPEVCVESCRVRAGALISCGFTQGTSIEFPRGRMSFQRKWLLAVPAVMIAIAVMGHRQARVFVANSLIHMDMYRCLWRR